MAHDGADSARKSAIETLSENVIVERARARLFQSDLAERTGLRRATISNIENALGDVSLRKIEKLANAFGRPVSVVLDGTEDDLQETDAAIDRRRETSSPEEFVDAFDLLIAVEEARRSRPGRRRTARTSQK
jgi:transcriptional regulator with XRE-family HTH domain